MNFLLASTTVPSPRYLSAATTATVTATHLYLSCLLLLQTVSLPRPHPPPHTHTPTPLPSRASVPAHSKPGRFRTHPRSSNTSLAPIPHLPTVRPTGNHIDANGCFSPDPESSTCLCLAVDSIVVTNVDGQASLSTTGSSSICRNSLLTAASTNPQLLRETKDGKGGLHALTQEGKSRGYPPGHPRRRRHFGCRRLRSLPIS